MFVKVYRHVLISRNETPKTEGASSKSGMHGNSSTPEKIEQRTEELKLTPTRSTRSATKASKEEQNATPEKPAANESSAKVKNADCEKKNEIEEKFGDLIEFYNLVYVKEIKDFALKFAQARTVCVYLFLFMFIRFVCLFCCCTVSL